MKGMLSERRVNHNKLPATTFHLPHYDDTAVGWHDVSQLSQHNSPEHNQINTSMIDSDSAEIWWSFHL